MIKLSVTLSEDPSSEEASIVIMRTEPVVCPIVRIRIDVNFWTVNTYQIEKHSDDDNNSVV